MGYKIVYGNDPGERLSCSNARLRVMTAVLLLTFCLLVRLVWPEGTELLREVLTGGPHTATETAFLEMIENLRNGMPAGESITVFCGAVLENAR